MKPEASETPAALLPRRTCVLVDAAPKPPDRRGGAHKECAGECGACGGVHAREESCGVTAKKKHARLSRSLLHSPSPRLCAPLPSPHLPMATLLARRMVQATTMAPRAAAAARRGASGEVRKAAYARAGGATTPLPPRDACAHRGTQCTWLGGWWRQAQQKLLNLAAEKRGGGTLRKTPTWHPKNRPHTPPSALRPPPPRRLRRLRLHRLPRRGRRPRLRPRRRLRLPLRPPARRFTTTLDRRRRLGRRRRVRCGRLAGRAGRRGRRGVHPGRVWVKRPHAQDLWRRQHRHF